MRYIIKNIVFFCTAVVFGALLFVAWTSNYEYQQIRLQFIALQQKILSAPVWTYGVIEAVSATSSSVTIRYSSTSIMAVSVVSNTYIARQDLIGQNGAYTQVTAPTPATLSDMHVGDNVATIATLGTTGEAVAILILFGNPL